jgi:hypothetical protein
MMTKQRLAQYGKLKREIGLLEDRILAAESGGELVTDTVRGSMKEPPYAMRTVVIKGYGSQEVPRLSARLARCAAECAAVEQFVDGITDSTVRQLVDLHFLEGRTMEEAAKMAGYSRRQAIRLVNGLFESRHPASPHVT